MPLSWGEILEHSCWGHGWGWSWCHVCYGMQRAKIILWWKMVLGWARRNMLLREKQGVTWVSSMLPWDEPFLPDFAKIFGARICI